MRFAVLILLGGLQVLGCAASSPRVRHEVTLTLRPPASGEPKFGPPAVTPHVALNELWYAGSGVNGGLRVLENSLSR